jgi:hypothetical protein
MIQLDDALSDVIGVMIGKRNDAGSEFDSRCSLTSGGEEHFGTSYHFPTGRVVFTTPEFVVAKPL